MTVLILVSMAFLGTLAIFWFRRSAKPGADETLTVEYAKLLQSGVRYYQKLNPEQQELFVKHVQAFLKHVHIEGVGTEVNLTDKVLVAASAIIPIFGFGDWRYPNLTNVILYPNTFNEEFQFEGDDRRTMGMVGTGYMNGQMILSKPSLHAAFDQPDSKHHTPIHEFVHLLDKTDGATDGIPENFMERRNLEPWLDLMHHEMDEIRQGDSDINPYTLTGDAEFFAVVSEYFFQQPELMAARHPEIYHVLTQFFRQDWLKNTAGS